MSKAVFAVDVGGVLASKQHDGEPTPFAHQVLVRLGEVFDLQVVSMCGHARALQTREWLDQHDFTRLFSQQTYITFKESNKNRVLEEIKAQFFIDDRAKHVLPALEVVPVVYHIAPAALDELPATKGKYQWVDSWATLLRSKAWRAT